MKCDHVNQALKPRLSKATRINHHHRQELNHQQALKSLKIIVKLLVTIKIKAMIKGGAQVEATQEDASRVDNDDDGGPIQPQRQVSHPRVHQTIQWIIPLTTSLGVFEEG